MEPQNPDYKTLEEASGSSGFFSLSQDSDGLESGSEVRAPEKGQGVRKNSEGMDASNGDSVNVGCIATTGQENEEENDALRSHGGDSVRKIEVSGDNLSLVVDFSGSLGSDGPFEVTGSGLMVDSEKEDEVGKRTRKFSVGDYVWVLTKSLNWWPARVIDPLSNVASNNVAKPDKKESLLVSYFGQSHVAWCLPSQLKPFRKNFDKMLKQRKSRSFSGAIEKALADFCKSLKLEMTCSCISKENGCSGGDCELGERKSCVFGEFSVFHLEPEEFLARLKNLAGVVSAPGMLELAVMQSCVSAFFTSVGHKQMPIDQLRENSGEQSSRACKEKPRKRVLEGSKYRKMARERDSGIRDAKGKVEEMLISSPKMEFEASDIGNGDGGSDVKNEKGFASRERKKSKYLSYPYINSNETEDNKVPESTDQSSPSNVMGSSMKRFQTQWFQKNISEDNISAKSELVNMSPSDLLSKLRFIAMDSRYAKEIGNISLIEWFFSKFRISGYHDESLYELHCKNTICQTDSSADEAEVEEEKLLKRKKNSGKSKMKSLSGLSDVNTDFSTNNSSPKNPQQNLPEKSAPADLANEPITNIPDLNGGLTNLSFLPDHLNSTSFPSLPDFYEDCKRSGPLMLNFQTMTPCSTNSIPSREFNFHQSGSNGNHAIHGISQLSASTEPPQKKKRKRRTKAELAAARALAAAAAAIPDLNRTTTAMETQVKPKQRRRRRKREEIFNIEARGTTILFLKFAPEVPMPSRDDLTSTFSGFGPLNASETHLSKDSGGAQIAFVSSADAVEAVKSLEKNNPFGETLISFRLQQKPAVHASLAAQRIETHKIPVNPVAPISRSGEAPMSVDYIRQNLVMMTSMLEQAGDSLSKEMRQKLESEIKGLLEKVSSLPSSSSS